MTETLIIHSDESGLNAPESVAPGHATFKASTSAEGPGWVGLARFKAKPDWDAFRANVRDMVSDEPDRIVQGTPALYEQVAMLGGAVIHPDLPGEFELELVPGEYVFFDYPDTVASEQPRHRFMSVSGLWNVVPPTSTDVAIRAVTGEDGPCFVIAGNVLAGVPILFENAMDEPQFAEFVLLPVQNGTGEGELAQYFSQFQDGSSDWPPNPPFDVTRGSGCLPLSAGRQAIMRLPAGPGRYVVVNWLKSATTGVRMAKLGQWAIVEIR